MRLGAMRRGVVFGTWYVGAWVANRSLSPNEQSSMAFPV